MRLWEAVENMIKLNDHALLDFNLPQNGCLVVLLQNKHINHKLHDALVYDQKSSIWVIYF